MLPEVPLDGKPPKSIGEMRHVLKAIMNSNPDRPRGPYVDGLPPQERKAVILAAEDQRYRRTLARRFAQHDQAAQQHPRRASVVLHTTRPPVTLLTAQQAEELLRQSRWCGALCGFLLGSQLAFALTIIITTETPIVLAAAACVPLGFLLGDYSARCYLRRRWPEYYWLNNRHSPPWPSSPQ
jgi:hypothetical protein